MCDQISSCAGQVVGITGKWTLIYLHTHTTIGTELAEYTDLLD